MCGRYDLTTPPEALARLFGAGFSGGAVPNWPARHNIAPTQMAPVLGRDRAGALTLNQLHWGLVPSWARDASGAARLINARADGVADKPSFRSAFQKRRCLVPATGFYEWTGAARARQSWRIRHQDEAPLAFAGLYELWRGPESAPLPSPLASFTIVTTEAGPDIAALHHRQPVILPPEAWAPWLAPETPAADLLALLAPSPAGLLTAYRVDPRVGNVRHDDAGLIAPLPETELPV